MKMLSMLLVLCLATTTYAVDDWIEDNEDVTSESQQLKAWGEKNLDGNKIDLETSSYAPFKTITSGDAEWDNGWNHYALCSGSTISSPGTHRADVYIKNLNTVGGDSVGTDQYHGLTDYIGEVETQVSMEADATGTANGSINVAVNVVGTNTKITAGDIWATASFGGAGVALFTASFDPDEGDDGAWWMERIDPYNGYQSAWSDGPEISQWDEGDVEWSKAVVDGAILTLTSEVYIATESEGSGTNDNGKVEVDIFNDVETDIE